MMVFRSIGMSVRCSSGWYSGAVKDESLSLVSGFETKGTETLGLVLNFGTCLEIFGTVSSRSHHVSLFFT